MALGLGRTVMGGSNALRFSPRYPTILPQFYNTQSVLRNSQKSFYAMRIDREPDNNAPLPDREEKVDVKIAWEAGLVPLVASYYSREDSHFFDYFIEDGRPVITFKPLLGNSKWKLMEVFTQIISESRLAMGRDRKSVV